MAKARMDLSTFVGKLLEEHDGDVLREGVRVLAQALMDTEVTVLVGAERHERSDERTAYRNGTRLRTWDTRVGPIAVATGGYGTAELEACGAETVFQNLSETAAFLRLLDGGISGSDGGSRAR